MKHLWKGIAKVLFYSISAALLAYAAYRSLDFITSTLPADQQIVGYLALAATSGGAIAWLMIFLHDSDGLGQKITAAIMTVIDLLGEFSLFTADTLLQTGRNGLIDTMQPDEIRTFVLALSALVALNIAASFAYHLTDPENAKRLRIAIVRGRLEAETLARIEADMEKIIPDQAAALAAQFNAEMLNTYSNHHALGLQVAPEHGDKTRRFEAFEAAVPAAADTTASDDDGQTSPN